MRGRRGFFRRWRFRFGRFGFCYCGYGFRLLRADITRHQRINFVLILAITFQLRAIEDQFAFALFGGGLIMHRWFRTFKARAYEPAVSFFGPIEGLRMSYESSSTTGILDAWLILTTRGRAMLIVELIEWPGK